MLQTRAFFVLLAIALLLTASVGPVASADGRERGIDVSRFQGKINWKKVGRSKKVEFAFVQASRGSGNDCAVVPDRCGADEFYRRNYKGASKENIKVGAYHRAFMDGKNKKGQARDARDEAKLFAKRVGNVKGGDLLPALDVETPFGGLNQKEVKRWIEIWLDEVKKKLGEKAIIYTNRSSWSATGDTEEFARKGHRLWVANFNVKKPAVPADNWSGQGWSIWQFTSSGSVKGIEGNVDENKLRVGFGKVTA